MAKEMMTIVGAFLNPGMGYSDGDNCLNNHFAVVSLVTHTRQLARVAMKIYEAAELCFLPSARFQADMRLAEDPVAFVKRRETLKYKARWLAEGQVYAAEKAKAYTALHGAAPAPGFVALWETEGFRYAGQTHMAAQIKRYAGKAETRAERLMKRHAKWTFEMFQRTLSDGTRTPHGYPSNIGGVVEVSGHALEQVFSKKGIEDSTGLMTFPPVKAKLWGEPRNVYKIGRESDAVPMHITFLGMPYSNTEEEMVRKVVTDDAARVAYAQQR